MDSLAKELLIGRKWCEARQRGPGPSEQQEGSKEGRKQLLSYGNATTEHLPGCSAPQRQWGPAIHTTPSPEGRAFGLPTEPDVGQALNRYLWNPSELNCYHQVSVDKLRYPGIRAQEPPCKNTPRPKCPACFNCQRSSSWVSPGPGL